MKPFIPTIDQAERALDLSGNHPVYLTSAAHLRYKVDLLKSAFGSRMKIFYAIKANYNPAIVSTLKDAGIDGLDTVAPYEILLGEKLGFTPQEMLYTGNSSTSEEMAFVHGKGVTLNIGSLCELERFAKLHRGEPCALRLNVDVGAGECDFVVTGGEDTKFGISDGDIPTARQIITDYDLHIIGIHAHIGSGFYQKDSFIAGVKGVLDRAAAFKDTLNFVDFGGGFGIRYHPDKAPVDITDWAQSVAPLLNDFATDMEDSFHYRIEPGKFLVGESTCLLTRVSMVKPERKTTFIGTNTGFNHLIRPALYQSYHPILNLSGAGRAEQSNLTIVGNVCESGDIFAEDITLPEPREGDIFALLTAGGYGQSMSSIYQLRAPAAEAMVGEDETITLTKGKKSFDDLFAFIS